MKAITLHQPTASLLFKSRRLRLALAWGTSHRGQLAIHAGTRPFAGGARYTHCFVRHAAEAFGVPQERVLSHIERLPLGAVLGHVDIFDCRRIISARYVHGGRVAVLLERQKQWRTIAGLDAAIGDFNDGRYVWFTRWAWAFDAPIPARGNRRLWEWEWRSPVGGEERT